MKTPGEWPAILILTPARSAGRDAVRLAEPVWAGMPKFFDYFLVSVGRFRYSLGRWNDHWSFRVGQ
jgi:hypothetical protein